MRVLLLLGLAFWLAGCSSAVGDGHDGGPGDGDGGSSQTCETDADCPAGMFCVGQRCAECRYRTDCPAGETCLQGECVTDCEPGTRCGEGGTCCPGDWECIGDRCLPPCDGERCGHWNEQCCGQGLVCEIDRCVIDCGDRERCGRDLDLCCASGQICYGLGCVTPEGSCHSRGDCPAGTFCEPDLAVCIQESAAGDCLYHPPAGVFEPVIEWQWDGSAVEPGYDQIMMAPAVAQLTDDNADGRVDHLDVPDVVFSTFTGSAYNSRGVLRVVSGDGSRTHLDLTAVEVHPGSCPAIGDLDGDGVCEIVIDRRLAGDSQISGTYALRIDGSVMWLAEGTGCSTGGPAIANLDADPQPEIVTSDAVLNHDGTFVCRFPAGSRVPAAADIDLDGSQEVLSGRGAYRAADSGDGSCEVVWELAAGGYPAVGDFDADPYAEIVFPSAGRLVMVDHEGAQVWSVPIPLDPPRIQEIYGIADCSGSTHKACNPGGGPPTVADFDGDGQPEIGLAARWYYLVYDADGSVLWAHRTKDYSSAVTGSSVFDFEADGRTEVVYNDELFMRVYYGEGSQVDADGDGYLDPEILIEIPNPSGTLLEYPLVVDVDADGRSEIVLAANNYAFAGFTGVRVFGDALDNWVPTRRIWNQHSYHVTNVCDGLDSACSGAGNRYGAVPAEERPNWDVDWLNNFRQNAQGEGLFYAPDLVILDALAACSATLELYLSFDVMNQGSRSVPAGVPITVRIDAELVQSVQTSQALRPGQLEHFALSFQLGEDKRNSYLEIALGADDTGDGSGRFNECEDGGEDNNTARLDGVLCGTEL